MQNVTNEELKSLCEQAGLQFESKDPLPQSGGDRRYFRVQCTEGTYIASASENVAENNTFFSWGDTFTSLQIPVPKVLAIAKQRMLYLQQDLGTSSLLDMVAKHGHIPEVFACYKQVLKYLVRLQIDAHKKLDYSLCLAAPRFNFDAALFDLNYFREFYVDHVGIAHNPALLQAEFEILATQIDKISLQGFMYRDLQGRNVMVHNGLVFFIDYQGGMQGPPQYDVASLLYQAKAELPQQWKQDLFDYYTDLYQHHCAIPFDSNLFKCDYQNIVLMRLLQVLGAYGRRGLLEGKAHFVDSIPLGIKNLQDFVEQHGVQSQFPELGKLVTML
jgi:RNase adapter protein RapZ